jgi:alanyl-tRNA synthetase
VASGVRRIEAVTGASALARVNEEERRLSEVSRLLSSGGEEVVDKLRQLLERQRKLERELESLRSKTAGSALGDLVADARDVAGMKVVAARIPGLDAKALRDSVDRLKQQLNDCVVVLAAASEGRVALVGGVHGAALDKIKAGDLVAHVAARIGGKGGGRADMAQGGGTDGPELDAALAGVADWLASRLRRCARDFRRTCRNFIAAHTALGYYRESAAGM